jgi:hypothetical protein
MTPSRLSLCLFLLIGCVGPYKGPPEKLSMPKVAKADPNAKKPGAEPTTLDETCKTDFDGKPFPVAKRQIKLAKSITQDAENKMSEITGADPATKMTTVLASLSLLRDALKADPYSPQATYTMAVSYAHAGKKKCAVLMLERLASLSDIPENVADVTKLKGKVKTEKAFEPFKADAAAALGD